MTTSNGLPAPCRSCGGEKVTDTVGSLVMQLMKRGVDVNFHVPVDKREKGTFILHLYEPRPGRHAKTMHKGMDEAELIEALQLSMEELDDPSNHCR